VNEVEGGGSTKVTAFNSNFHWGKKESFYTLDQQEKKSVRAVSYREGMGHGQPRGKRGGVRNKRNDVSFALQKDFYWVI